MTITAPSSTAVDDDTTLVAAPASGSSTHQSTDEHAKHTARVERLNTASARRVIDPDAEVAGSVGPGQVVSRRMLSVFGLDLDLTDEQWTTLSREEMASIFDAGVRFESTLMANFGRSIAYRRDLTDPRVTYMLHEVGEETRHSRLFIRIIGQLAPKAKNPFTSAWLKPIDSLVTGWMLRHDAVFMVMILFGEEGPDLVQRLALEDPETDPFIKDVNRYHRSEEARHLSYGRTVLGELFAKAGWFERFVIRHFAPAAGMGTFDSLVHPGVYATVGLPTWKTWNAARKTPERMALKRQVLRPVCDALVAAGAFRRNRATRAWRRALAE